MKKFICSKCRRDIGPSYGAGGCKDHPNYPVIEAEVGESYMPHNTLTGSIFSTYARERASDVTAESLQKAWDEIKKIVASYPNIKVHTSPHVNVPIVEADNAAIQAIELMVKDGRLSRADNMNDAHFIVIKKRESLFKYKPIIEYTIDSGEVK